jgi:glycosyltransferase involved in cell wall biosynthesis
VTAQFLFSDDYLNRLYTTGKRSVLKTAMQYLKRSFMLLGVFRYDLVWIEKELYPYMPAVAERLLRLLGKPFVVDYDDAIFHNYDRSPHPMIRKLLGRKIDMVMRQASQVVTGNEYLAERARAAGAFLPALIPTVVDLTHYRARVASSTVSPVIGWIGSPSTQQYLVIIRDVLAEVCRTMGARLMLIGANPCVAARLPGIEVVVVPWNEGNEAALIRQMDIGIMPLPDAPWEKGKCGYKLIQYMACGVPVIASPVGVNVDIVSQSQSGLLADTLAEWRNALFLLLRSVEHRRQFGAAGRLAVERTYCLAVQAPVLSKILHAAINRDKP